MIKLNKKAISIWMSWVLLVSFMVILSMFVYSWITDYTIKSNERLEKRYTEGLCDEIAIDADVCQKAEDLNIVIHNVGNLGIDKVIFRVYDLYDDVETKKLDLSVKAGQEKEIDVLKQGAVNRLEAIPVISTSDEEVVCRDKMQATENITVC